MKFHKRHQADILNTIECASQSNQDFTFIKRKGRIITHHILSKSEFSYFEIKDIAVDEQTREFLDVTYFEVRVNGGEKKNVGNWKNVITEFNIWLDSI